MRHLLFSLLIAPAPVLAQDAAPAEALRAAWQDWAEGHDVTRTTFAVIDGETRLIGGIGADPDTPFPLASLSKTITAACIASLTKDGTLALQDTAGDLLDDDGSAARATVAALLTQSAGIGPDATQGNAALAAAEEDRTAETAAWALGRADQAGTPGTYAYNNENYALLGAMIDAVTGTGHEDACRAAVLAPAGVESAAIEGRWIGHGAWGGWSLSAPGLARFLAHAYSADGAFGPDPADWPAAGVGAGGGARYGMGQMWAPVEDDAIAWNIGQLCWNGKGDGAYFARYGRDGPIVAVTFAGCLTDGPAVQDLDAALAGAAQGG